MSEGVGLMPDSQNRPADSCVMVIFGATGDLTQRKLLPALYNLAKARLLSSNFALIGAAVDPLGPDAFRDRMLDAIRAYVTDELDMDVLEWFAQRIHYVSGDFRDSEFYVCLKNVCAEVRRDHGLDDKIFYYLATAPSFFGEIIRQLGRAGMAGEDSGNWRRVIIEKPFGHDLESARELNADIKKSLTRTPDLPN